MEDLWQCSGTAPSPYSTDDDLADSPPMERLYSPLSSSAESISSIISSSSSRSSAEREIERQQRRQLLDASLLKMRASNNLPLRKHLLVFNTVKQLQRDLDLLDDEELYCNLIGEGCGERMEVDERRWPFGTTTTTTTSSSLSSSTTSCSGAVAASAAEAATAESMHPCCVVTATAAPPQQEERRVAEEATSLISDDLDMDVCQVVQQQKHEVPSSTWSWAESTTNRYDDTTAHAGFDLFESIQDALGESLDGWSWTGGDTNMSSCVATSDSWWSGGLSPFGASSRLDSLWAMDADPLGASNLSRFELQHLFPSQVLLQA
ncbi:hypothetical protein Q1695_001793 [Nippostrongylus brasiliensis]|nr:hypothetical protein Q1695_001793 [Nippostrongylus brasiliensis]